MNEGAAEIRRFNNLAVIQSAKKGLVAFTIGRSRIWVSSLKLGFVMLLKNITNYSLVS